jgi:hypothetical protein
VENPLAEEINLLIQHTVKLQKAGASRNALRSIRREIQKLPLLDSRHQGSHVNDIHRFLNSLAVTLDTERLRTGVDGIPVRATCTSHSERVAVGQRRIAFRTRMFLCSECLKEAKRQDEEVAKARG